jgi:hypothetical protein
MEFLSDDWWLRDTAVTENIVKRNGMWEIQLVFAHYLQPWKLIKRNIARSSVEIRQNLIPGIYAVWLPGINGEL